MELLQLVLALDVIVGEVIVTFDVDDGHGGTENVGVVPEQ